MVDTEDIEVMGVTDEIYRAALERARRDYAAALARLQALEAERDCLDVEIRRLRGLVYALSCLVGEDTTDILREMKAESGRRRRR